MYQTRPQRLRLREEALGDVFGHLYICIYTKFAFDTSVFMPSIENNTTESFILLQG